MLTQQSTTPMLAPGVSHVTLWRTIHLSSLSPPNPQPPFTTRSRRKLQASCPSSSSQTQEARCPRTSNNPASAFCYRYGPSAPHRSFFYLAQRRPYECWPGPWFLCTWIIYAAQSKRSGRMGYELPLCSPSADCPFGSTASLARQQSIQSLPALPASHHAN
jgi:hypothetical protein